MSTIESQNAAQHLNRSTLVNSFYKLSATFGTGKDSLVQRLAGLVFLIRVVSAVLAMIGESALLFFATKARLGLYGFVCRPSKIRTCPT